MDLQRGAGADLQPGAVIAGRYRADTRVGAGGMGAVWSGEHLTVGVKVALKQLLTSAAENHEVVTRFRREAKFLGKIRSDHVARILDFVEDPTYGFILVMEYIEGETLSKTLGARTLSVEETIDLGTDIAAALVDLHRHNIVHRDLKPGNIIVQKLGNNTHRAVIVDFGVSRILEQGVSEDEEVTNLTRADMALGTIEYMAPEQILNSRDVTPASDIYALGAILFRAHAGKHVFGDVYDAELAKKKIWTDPPPLSTGRTDKLGKGLEAVINRALTRSPKKRYTQADEILAELNMLRDLMKAASFDMDTMTTRDNSAIIEALSAAEAKKETAAPAAAAATPANEAVPSSASPSSTPAQSSPSLNAQTSTITPEPRIVRKGVSTPLALFAFVAALAFGTLLGTQIAPDVGRVIPALAIKLPEAPAPTCTAVATTAPATTAAATALPSADATAAAPAATTAEPVASAEPSGTASADKPKLYGKIPEVHPSSTAAAGAATTAAATTPPAPTSAPVVTATSKPTSVAPTPPKDPNFAP